MDYTNSFSISAAGMTLERTRVEVASLNLTNANTIQGADGVNYRPLRVVARAAGLNGVASFGGLIEQGLGDGAISNGIPAVSIEPSNTAARMVYEPGHPLADTRGFVAYAGVDAATEMVTLMSAMRSYEANVAAMNTAKILALKALEIGGAN